MSIDVVTWCDAWHPASTAALSGEQVSYVGPDGRMRRWWHERSSGVPVEQPFGILMEFDDGLFIRGRSWFDPEEAVRAAAALAQSGEPS